MVLEYPYHGNLERIKVVAKKSDRDVERGYEIVEKDGRV